MAVKRRSSLGAVAKALTVLGLVATSSACQPIITASLPTNYNCPGIWSDFGDSTNMEGRVRHVVHTGMDIGGGSKGYPVIAAAAGYVMIEGWHSTGGNRVAIMHDLAKTVTGEYLHTGYAHMDTMTVKTGQRVNRGQQIGTIGRTGGGVTSLAHLHFVALSSKHISYTLYITPSDNIAYFVDNRRIVNPHRYWSNNKNILDPGVIAPFVPETSYATKPLFLTYPVPCADESGNMMVLQ